MVERNSRNKVVQNVGLNDIVENVLTNESKVSVNSGSSSSQEIPVRSVIVRHPGISVLQIGDVDQPVVNPEPRSHVHKHHGGVPPFLRSIIKSSQGGDNANITNDDVVEILLVKQRRVGHVVVGDKSRSARIPLARGVGDQVVDPPKQLLDDKSVDGVQRSILGSLEHSSQSSSFEPGLLLSRHENHISSHVSSSLVVFRVA